MCQGYATFPQPTHCFADNCANLWPTVATNGKFAGFYCSKRCIWRLKDRRKRGVPLDPTCSRCRVPLPLHTGRSLKMCAECAPLPYEPKPIRTVSCPTCGTEFETRNKRYCSVKCRPSSTNGGRIGPEWQALRGKVLAEESWCWLCSAPVDVSLKGMDRWGPTVDHVWPVSLKPEYLMERDWCRLAHRLCNGARCDKAPTAGQLREHWEWLCSR